MGAPFQIILMSSIIILRGVVYIQVLLYILFLSKTLITQKKSCEKQYGLTFVTNQLDK
jgi:hypothetical protein